MSILEVDNIVGPEKEDFKIRMDSPNHLNIAGILSLINNGQMSIPCGTTAQRPASPNAGMIRFNIQTYVCEVYNGTDWDTFPVGSGVDGTSAATAAPSAKWLYDNGVKTSGKELLWISTSNGPKEVWCDFDTNDANGQSGWMLVAAFEEGYRWGGDGQNITTSEDVVGPTSASSYPVSANFADMDMNMFRCTSNATIASGSSLGSGASADWYYNWNTTIKWKQVWAPTNNTQHYLSNASNPSVQRTCIRKFDNSYNIRWGYNNPNHKYNNITDYGYTNSRTDTADYSYGVVGSGNAPVNGWFNVWDALSTGGNQFEWFYVGRSANYSARSGGDTDGTLAIPTNGSGIDLTGQDNDNNIGAKVGNDDNTNWGGATTDGSSNAGNNGAITTTPFWWWIK